MEYLHISQIDFASNLNNRVYGVFLARDVDVRLQRDGNTKFIDLTMCDKSTTLNARKFGASDSEIELMKNGCVYCAAIDVKPYDKSPTGYSCILYNFDIYNELPSNFVEWADGMSESAQVVQEALNAISNSIYKDLVSNLYTENWEKLVVWAAATGHHHNILGGLLVHTAEVVKQSMILADYWNEKYGANFINKELLISGALLHDLGKIYELNTNATTGEITYSTEAALETHITKCISMIDMEAYKLHFGTQSYYTDENGNKTALKHEEQIAKEKEALTLLRHMVLAHHGKKEYGSPIEMNIPEAVILHKADDISAAMFDFNKKFKTMDKSTSSVTWSSNGMVVAYKDYTKE